MKLSDFENHIESKILQRGDAYYRSGAILSITEESDNTYKAVVEGTENYTVIVRLGTDGEILFSHCNCPYDMGSECKHEVAVYYSLRKMKKPKSPAGSVIDLGEYAKKKVSLEKESPECRIHRILSALSKEELVSLLVSLSVEYPDFGKRVEFTYSNDTEEDEIKNCLALIRSYVDKYSNRDGYIRYENTFEAIEGARLVVERAGEAADCGQYARAVTLYLCIIREMVPLLNYVDDSDGYMGSIIEEAVSFLSSITEYDISQEAMADIFEKLLREAVRKYLDDWPNWRLDLLETCAYLANTPDLRRRLEKELDSLAERFTDSQISNHAQEKIAEIRYSLILNFDGQDKAEEFLESNLKYTNFRVQAINKALSQKDYSRAENLALDGEEKDKDYVGLVNQWKKYRYETYSHSGELDKQRQIALEFVLQGDFDFYRKLKETYPQEEWLTVYPGILRALEEKKRYFNNYASILIEEKELARLLAYVKANPSAIIQYYKHLLPVYLEEVYQIFLSLIQHGAKNASSRGGYKQVCEHIKLLCKAGGAEQARQVTASLISAYPRRPAFKDELLKIKL